MKIIIFLPLFLISTNCYALQYVLQYVQDDGHALERIMAESIAVRQEVRNERVSILDLGSQNGEFLPRIIRYLERLHIDVYKAVGIDNGTFLPNSTHEEREALISAFDKNIHTSDPRIHLEFADIKKASRALGRFDFVFYNAPYPPASVIENLPYAMNMVRDQGIIFLRFHAGDEHRWVDIKLREFIDSNGYSILMFRDELPEGFYQLEHKVYVIKKTDFINQDNFSRFVTGLSKQLFESKLVSVNA